MARSARCGGRAWTLTKASSKSGVATRSGAAWARHGLVVGPVHPIIRRRRRGLQYDARTAAASHRVIAALDEQREQEGSLGVKGSRTLIIYRQNGRSFP